MGRYENMSLGAKIMSFTAKGVVIRKRNGTMMKKAAKAAKIVIEKVAVKKADANCLGFMYEPKKPKKLIKKSR